jgi:hypothetical protein
LKAKGRSIVWIVGNYYAIIYTFGDDDVAIEIGDLLQKTFKDHDPTGLVERNLIILG